MADGDVDEAIEMVNEIQSLAESSDLPSAGEEFAASVSEKAGSIGETIEESGYVTENQERALENMLSGLRRWFRD